MMNPKSHLLALRLIQNAQDYLQALINQAQLSRLQQEVWEDALADGVGDDLVGLFCPPAPVSATHPGSTVHGDKDACPSCGGTGWLETYPEQCARCGYAKTLTSAYLEGEYPVFTPPTEPEKE